MKKLMVVALGALCGCQLWNSEPTVRYVDEFDLSGAVSGYGKRTVALKSADGHPLTLKGKVYHRTLECRSLSVHPHRITAAQLATERNNSGGKYYPCESCCGGRAVKQGDLYVTDDGTRYHVRLDCSKLVRNIREIPLSEAAADYRPCAYCGGE